MADNYNQRSNRPNDPYARPADPSAANNDPLAELARLIGQTDPFGEFGRDARRAAQPVPPRAPAPPASEWGDAPLSATPAAEPRRSAPSFAINDPAFGAPSQQRFAPQAEPVQPSHPYGAPGTGHDDAFAEQAPPAHGADAYNADYDSHAYAQTPQDGPGYEGYYEQQHAGMDGEEVYDDLPPRRRRRIVAGAVVFALVVLGVAGAWGYRSLFGPSGSSAPPPVIKAEATPSKVVPAAQSQNGDPSSSKQIYDRIGDRGQGEKVVSREEQPVEVKPQPRVIFPGPGGSPGNPSSPAAGMPGGPGASANASAGSEPKRIKTVVIRPDQPVAPDQAVAGVSAPPSARVAMPPTRPVSNPPTSIAEAAAAPAPTPPAAKPAARPPAEASASSHGPLSLAPDAKSRAAAKLANAPAAAPAASASTGATGGYAVVQVSAQKSEGEAHSSFQALAAKYPNVLGGRQPIIKRADLGAKGTWYRTMVGPFGSSEEANQFCSSLKAAGGSCIVQRN